MFTFKQLQDEIKRSAVKNQGGTNFDTAVKNVINRSIFRLSMEGLWRCLRRKTTISTVASYSEGSGAGEFTEDSANITVTGATFLTDGVKIGRRIKLSGSARYYTILSITGETTLVMDRPYDGTTTTTGTYEILGQEEYNLPIQSNHRIFLWHEEYGYPYQMSYLPTQEFYSQFNNNTNTGTPEIYRMWSEDMVLSQIKSAGVVTIASSSTADTSKSITVFGTVSGYPDYEIISTNASNGTTAVNGTKSFSSIDRITKGSSTTGRITITSDSATNTVAVIPAGDTTAGAKYSKIQLYPLPTTVFPINVFYYKEPYRLVNDGDIHEFGQEFDQAIIFLATAIMRYEDSQEEGDKWIALYKDELKQLKKNNIDKIDWLPRLMKPETGWFGGTMAHKHLSYAQLGGYYGPRSW